MELRDKNYEKALKAAEHALLSIEKHLLNTVDATPVTTLKANAVFLENLIVLLVSYFNYGMC
jgi:hypothetical protein